MNFHFCFAMPVVSNPRRTGMHAPEMFSVTPNAKKKVMP